MLTVYRVTHIMLATKPTLEGSTGVFDAKTFGCPLLMRWTAPAAGIAMCHIAVAIEEPPRGSRRMQEVTTIGLDLAKNVFQVHGVDGAGETVIRRQLRRLQVLTFFSKQPPCLVGMEACATSHHWAREIDALGHEVRIMPARYVKAYVKRNKNDAADAQAICEAVKRAAHGAGSRHWGGYSRDASERRIEYPNRTLRSKGAQNPHNGSWTCVVSKFRLGRASCLPVWLLPLRSKKPGVARAPLSGWGDSP